MKSKKLKISITGPQGSGKSTQAKLLADFLMVTFIGMGDILREKSEDQDEIGKKIKEELDKGDLVDDKIVSDLIKIEVEKSGGGFVMDGYPRSINQLELFDPNFDKIFYLEIPDEIVLERLFKRGRVDDTPGLIAERLKIYHQLTEPLLARYKDLRILQIIDGSGLINKVQANIREALNG